MGWSCFLRGGVFFGGVMMQKGGTRAVWWWPPSCQAQTAVFSRTLPPEATCRHERQEVSRTEGTQPPPPPAAPLTLMAVMAKAIFRRPSMFVLRTRRMCWNFSGITRDCGEGGREERKAGSARGSTRNTASATQLPSPRATPPGAESWPCRSSPTGSPQHTGKTRGQVLCGAGNN